MSAESLEPSKVEDDISEVVEFAPIESSFADDEPMEEGETTLRESLDCEVSPTADTVPPLESEFEVHNAEIEMAPEHAQVAPSLAVDDVHHPLDFVPTEDFSRATSQSSKRSSSSMLLARTDEADNVSSIIPTEQAQQPISTSSLIRTIVDESTTVDANFTTSPSASRSPSTSPVHVFSTHLQNNEPEPVTRQQNNGKLRRKDPNALLKTKSSLEKLSMRHRSSNKNHSTVSASNIQQPHAASSSPTSVDSGSSSSSHLITGRVLSNIFKRKAGQRTSIISISTASSDASMTPSREPTDATLRVATSMPMTHSVSEGTATVSSASATTTLSPFEALFTRRSRTTTQDSVYSDTSTTIMQAFGEYESEDHESIAIHQDSIAEESSIHQQSSSETLDDQSSISPAASDEGEGMATPRVKHQQEQPSLRKIASDLTDVTTTTQDDTYYSATNLLAGYEASRSNSCLTIATTDATTLEVSEPVHDDAVQIPAPQMSCSEQEMKRDTLNNMPSVASSSIIGLGVISANKSSDEPIFKQPTLPSSRPVPKARSAQMTPITSYSAPAATTATTTSATTSMPPPQYAPRRFIHQALLPEYRIVMNELDNTSRKLDILLADWWIQSAAAASSFPAGTPNVV